MSFNERLIQNYFNLIYNPFYDFTTARLKRYQELQNTCINKLELEDNDKILCVGLGTGNEIIHILKINENVNIVGIDYSNKALQRARKKALELNKNIDLFIADAQYLEFPDASFDKVICIHVMDFIDDNIKVTNEIFRVLKDRGQFVITYPSAKEGIGLALNLLNNNINSNAANPKTHGLINTLVSPLQILAGIAYLPLLIRPKRKSYSHNELETMINQLISATFQIEEDTIYQDFIIHGEK